MCTCQAEMKRMDPEPIIVGLDKLCLPDAYTKLRSLRGDIVIEPVHFHESASTLRAGAISEHQDRISIF